MLKLLVDALGQPSPKTLVNVTVSGLPAPRPPPKSCHVLSDIEQGDYGGGRICEFGMRGANATLQRCGAACCSVPNCRFFVAESAAANATSPLWACHDLGKPCLAGEFCCRLKDATAVAEPFHLPGHTRGQTTPRDSRRIEFTSIAATLNSGGAGGPARRVLLLVNTHNTSAQVDLEGADVRGWSHTWVDRDHGHGSVAPGHEVLCVGGGHCSIQLKAYQVSVIQHDDKQSRHEP